MMHLTSQFKESALSREANVRLLKRIIRVARKVVRKYYHRRTSASVLATIENDIFLSCKPYYDTGWLTRLSISVTQNQYERQRNICHVYITLAFAGFLERFLIDCNVERTE